MKNINQCCFEYLYIFKSKFSDTFFGNAQRFDKFFSLFDDTCYEISASVDRFFRN